MNREEKCKIAFDRGMLYNPETGLITGVSGRIISARNSYGYIYFKIKLNGKDYDILGHQFAWYYTYGKCVECIDHINHIKDDNRLSNLRSVTQQQNCFNMRAKGYCWDKKAKKWVSYINVDYKRITLGYFDNESEAGKIYLDAKKIYHKI